MAVDDLELNLEDGNTPPPIPRNPSRTRWIVGGAIVLAVVIGGALRWWTLDRGTGDAAPVSTNATAGAQTALPPPVVLPPLDQMDAFLRVLIGTLSTRPELSRWLATDDLIHQMAIVIDRISKGGTPVGELGVLAPEGDFAVTGQGRTRTVAPASYQRYDGLAETIATLDAEAVARNYETIRPRLNEAYHSLGRSENDVHVALLAALDVLIATPIPEGPVTVIEGKGAVWAYADPALEALDPAQKQLLRMGPENAARVIAKLQDVRRQIEQ